MPWLLFLAAIGGALGGLAAVWRWGLHPPIKFIREKVIPLINYLTREVPNGGEGEDAGVPTRQMVRQQGVALAKVAGRLAGLSIEHAASAAAVREVAAALAGVVVEAAETKAILNAHVVETTPIIAEHHEIKRALDAHLSLHLDGRQEIDKQ